MSVNSTYAYYAILYELNSREFKRKLDLFPAEMRYYVVLANSIIGAENAQRVKETPEAIVRDSKEFVSKLLDVAGTDQDDICRDILETYLMETMKDELRYCCPNCANFSKCLDLEDLSLGPLFRRRANGEETDELKKEIALQIQEALQNTPYIDSDDAHKLCRDFSHQYSVSNIGEVFGRYSDIAAVLRNSFGIDYNRVQQEMITLNMHFFKKGIDK